MRAAAALLASSVSLPQLGSLLQGTRLVDAPVALDAGVCDTLDLGVADALIAQGPGALRALLVRLWGDAPLRESLQRVARRLAARAPHVLWLVAAVDEAGALAAIVTWSTDGERLKIASFLWETAHVVDSDAETLCALSGIQTGDDVTMHARCVEILGRETLTRRFYRSLEAQVAALAGTVPGRADDARTVALLYATRLLFLCFLEAKGWLDGDRGFMASRFDDCMRAVGGGFHRRVVLPLFFGTLNTPMSRRSRLAREFGRVPFLNGGLFTRAPVERRVRGWCCPDERFGELFEQLFQRYRFVAREDTATWSQASVDPEMLGRAFESLMARSERRSGGVYYTPHDLVARVAESGLSALRPATLEAMRNVRLLDPTCGSGAFLVYALERIADMRHALGDTNAIADIRRDVLARCIFGVDRSPTAVWLCQLRLWLAVVIDSEEDDPRRVPPLPNLDRNIRVGDALAGSAFTRDALSMAGSARLVQLRERYVRATGPRKQSLARVLDREERRRALTQVERAITAARFARSELLAVQRSRDLFGQRRPASADDRRALRRQRELLRSLRDERRRVLDGGALPFSFGAAFADVHARGGFDVVLGNPPWVRLHRIPAALRLAFRQTYEVFRSASWRSGAVAASASVGFASQVDLAALFVERSVTLLREGGVAALLLPAKLWRSLAGGGLRGYLLERTHVLELEDITGSRHAFEAAVYPSLATVRAGPPADARAESVIAVHTTDGRREWRRPAASLGLDASPGAPWILLPHDERDAFDRVLRERIMLASIFGAPRLGVKSGCNAAFLVQVTSSADGIATIVGANGERATIECEMLRPALRGEHVCAWERGVGDEWIIWTHDARGAPLARLPDRARGWLRRWYGELCVRSDAAHARRWWSLFRVDAADPSTSRVVWADIGRRPRALVLAEGDPVVPLNTCYVLRCRDVRDARTLAAILNSRLAHAWLNAVAEPARGGYRRYLGWTVGQLPLPRDWHRARALLGTAPRGDADLLEAVLDAYTLRREEVAALLEWTA